MKAFNSSLNSPGTSSGSFASYNLFSGDEKKLLPFVFYVIRVEYDILNYYAPVAFMLGIRREGIPVYFPVLGSI